MKEKNQPVGTVECNAKGCTEVCKVYQFRPRSEGRRTVFSGKHYFECPTHGRVGADGNSTVNEYVLCNAKMSGPGSADDSQKNRAPAQTPAPRAQGTSSGGARPAPAPATEKTPAKATRSSWAPLIDLE